MASKIPKNINLVALFRKHLFLCSECSGSSDPSEITHACRVYPINIVFLVDGSESITRENFDEIRQWILSVVDSFQPRDRPTPMKIIIVQFSDTPFIEVEKYVTNSSEELQDSLNFNFQQMRSGTKTYRYNKYCRQRCRKIEQANKLQAMHT